MYPEGLKTAVILTSENSLVAAEWASVRAEVQSYHFTVEDVERGTEVNSTLRVRRVLERAL